MAKLWYGHFDSIAGDKRELLAEDWARYIRSFITNGIRNGGTCLQVTHSGQMKVKIDEGIANIQGYIFILEKDSNGRYYEIEVEEAHNQYDRIDRLVLRLDKTEQKRSIEPIILRGVASGSPVPPTLTRNSLVYDLSLAQIRVKANTLVINSSNITDERFNEDVCGLINSILGLDSSVWQQQFDNFMASIRVENGELNDQFLREFEKFKEHMQQQIDDKENEIEEWYTSVKLDITKLQSFDFDNLAELKGTTKTTKILSNGGVEEKILMTNGGTNVAKRVTEKLTNGDIRTITTVYERNGVDVMKMATILTKVNADGSVTEVIS
ncbi:MAG: hypothetical protein K2F59_00880 [Eubacteriales bacterium]|nr:hypothetical protein [Eubacteriales bacterium]